MFEDYPNSSEITRQMRSVLHPLFQKLPDGISEFTFANIYLFHQSHHYRIARLPDGLFVVTGSDKDKAFFMLPFGLPDKAMLDELLGRFTSMKCVCEPQSRALAEMGYRIEEDRDNFDYLYSRKVLASLNGRQMHRKKNLLNAFMRTFDSKAKPLLDEYAADAITVLEQWRQAHGEAGDYHACKEAIQLMYELALCGGIYYIEDRPVGFTLGEENALGKSFVIHFEKAVEVDKYKGLYQFINQTFASFLPDKYETINREQDLGRPGLRRSKESYNPVGFVKKFRAVIA
jgi:hypothetical protein